MQKREYNRLRSNVRLISITESATDAIIVANKYGKISLWNKSAEKMFGLTAKKAIGNDLDIIMPARYREAHNKGMSRFINSGKKKVIGTTIEITAKKTDNTEFPIELSLSSWEESGEVFVCGIIRDITVRKRNEEIIQHSLKEKDTLLKEVHHRVKNNLQIIISLLKIYSQNVPKDSLQVFRECQDKIHSMALVHSSIYLSNDFENVDLGEYTNTFCNYFFGLTGMNSTNLSKNLDLVNIRMENAINFGLILSELLTNSYKHCIPVTSSPKITINLTDNEGQILFEYADNGPGIDPEILNKEDSSTTYGLEMIEDLVAQMDGSLKIDCSDGTNFRITFTPQTCNTE